MLANDGTGLLCLDFCNLDLALPVLVFALLLSAIVALLYEVKGLGHVLLGADLSVQLTLLVLQNRDLFLSLPNIIELLFKTLLFGIPVLLVL